MDEAVFVYGTLKNGFALHSYLKGCVFVSNAVLRDYVMLNLGSFPGIVAKPCAIVKGELYQVEPSRLSLLDEVEEVGAGLYRREKVTIALPAGKQILAWTYLLNRVENTSAYTEIADGIWKG